MAALLVAMAVMAIVLSTAMPVYQTVVRREREAELVFRGEQYARAIGLFQRKYTQRPAARRRRPGQGAVSPQEVQRPDHPRGLSIPGTIEPRAGESDEPRCRSRCRMRSGDAARVPEAAGRRQHRKADVRSRRFKRGARSHNSRPGRGQSPFPDSRSPFQTGRGQTSGAGQPTTGAFGRGPMSAAGQAANAQAGGGLVAVASKSTETSMRLYNGKNKYNEWMFMALASTTAAGGVGGSLTPGGRGELRQEAAAERHPAAAERHPAGATRRRHPAATADVAASRQSADASASRQRSAPTARIRLQFGLEAVRLELGVESSYREFLHHRIMQSRPHLSDRVVVRLRMNAIGQQHHVDRGSGSIHNDVPVNPTCPNARADIRVPHDDVGSIVSHPSARELPGMSVRLVMNVRSVCSWNAPCLPSRI